MPPLHVLVVDDEASICEFLSRVLGEAGYLVTATTSAPDALRIGTEQLRPDLLLTDLKMPAMEGTALAERMRETYPDLPILFFTGFADHAFQEATVLADGQAFLEKPASPDDVLDAVSRLLERRRVPPPGKPGIMWFSSLRQGLLTLNVSGRHR